MAVILSSKELQKVYQDVYDKMPPLLGVNWNTGKEWRTLPERYQALYHPDFEVHTFFKKVHFLQRKWDCKDSTRNNSAAYEACMVEVGVYNSILSRSRKELKVITTKHTWY